MKNLGLLQCIAPEPNSTLFITEDEKHKIEVYALPILGFEGKVVQLIKRNNRDIWDLRAINLFKNIHHQLEITNQIDTGLSLGEFKKLLLLENLEKIVFIDPLVRLQKELKKELEPPQRIEGVNSMFNSFDYQFAQRCIKDNGIDYFIQNKISIMKIKSESMYIYLASLAGWGIKQGSIIQQEIEKIFNETANIISSLTQPYNPSIHINAQYLREQYLKLNIAKDYQMAEEQQKFISNSLLAKLANL